MLVRECNAILAYSLRVVFLNDDSLNRRANVNGGPETLEEMSLETFVCRKDEWGSSYGP